MLKDQKKHPAAHLGRAAEHPNKCLRPLPDKRNQCGYEQRKVCLQLGWESKVSAVCVHQNQMRFRYWINYGD